MNIHRHNSSEIHHIKCEIYKKQAAFDAFISGKNTKVKRAEAVIYDQFHGENMMHPVFVEGSRKEILSQYSFYKCCYPDRSLGLVCREYYDNCKR